MKKSKVFIAVGAMLLAVTAVFAGKANKKYFSDTLNIGLSGTPKVVIPTQTVLTTTSINITGNNEPNYKLFVTLNDGTGGHSYHSQLYDGSKPVYVVN
jgi:type 1 fimbria pilin